jgi:hypothetical protein
VAVDRGNALGDQLDRANAELLAQASFARAPTDPVTSTQLALAAWRLDPGNPSARSALLQQYLAMRSVDGVVPAVTTEPIIGFAMSDDGRTMLLPESDELVVITGLPDGPAQRHSLPDAPPGFLRAQLSPTGRYAATMDNAGIVRLWDLAAGGGPRLLSGPVSTPDSRTLSFSGDRLLWLEPAPTGAELHIWDAVAAAPVAHGLGPIIEPDVVGVSLTPDPARVLIHLGPNGEPEKVRIVVRSFADGAPLGELPERSAVIQRGTAAALCVPEDPTAGGGPAAIITGPDFATPQRRIPLLAYSCDDFRRTITLDAQHVAERFSGPGDDVVRIRDLTDGSAYEVTLPRDPTTSDGGLPTGQRMMVLPNPDGTRAVLVPHATALLRLTAVPNPYVEADETPWLGQSDDGRTIVATDRRGDYTTWDRASGRTVARLEEEAIDGGPTLAPTVDQRLTFRTRAENGLSIAEYTLPTLQPVLRVVVPSRTGEPVSEVDTDALPDRIYTLADGLLTGWDRATGAPLGPPTDLATTPQRREWFAATHQLEARPGHPGEVAVLGPNNTIELWDVERGTQLATLPQIGGRWSYAFAFDASGSRLASAASVAALDVWDVDRLELVAPPIPIVAGQNPVGFTADGMIVTYSSEGGGALLMIWDPAAGRASGGAIQLALGERGEAEIVDGTRLDVEVGTGFTGAMPFTVALTASQWADELCRVSRRPFTDVERGAMPAGSTIDPPC